jgi:hypothetical protein
MSTYSIGIRTIARKNDYCRGTLLRLVETGTLQHPDILGLHVSRGEGITPNRNGCRALLLAANDEPDWVIFLEDDIDVINDFLGSVDRWLTKFARPEVLAYPLSCFYSGAMIHCAETGAWEYPIEKYYGSQGFVIRTSDAVKFAIWLMGWCERYNFSEDRDVSFDIRLGEWHREALPDQKFLLTPSPCFLDHTGEFSSIGPPGSWERVGRVESFAGREWSFNG